jgi:glycosyltransferase involved in cell wall biosynthesis
MDNPLVSIIVPVYNAEKYLRRCLDSIINQTYQNIEIILVDDGSKDASGQICDEYAEHDTRIRVIHKENGGVASARQVGLDDAKGEYVIHADPDDWVEPNWIEELFKYASKEHKDIVMCDYYREHQSKTIIVSEKPSSLKKEDLLTDLLHERIWGALWNKLIKRSCFEKYGISFNPEMSLWEDLYVITALIYKGASVSHLPIPLYHYDCYSNVNSIVRKPSLKQIFSQKIYIEKFESLLSEDVFLEAFYQRKFQIKRRCFRTGKKNIDIFIGLFLEFNQRFIEKNPFRWRDLRAYRGDIYKMERVCMALTLKYHSDLGYKLFDFWKKYGTKSFSSLLK